MEQRENIILMVALEPKDLNYPWLWSARNLFRWFVILFGFFLLFTIARDTVHSISASTFLLLVGAAILTGIFLPYLRILRMFHKIPALRRPRQVVLGQEGLCIEAEDATGEYKWPLFWKIQETYKGFLLFQTTNSATYLPKRCFASPEDISRFKNLLRINYRGKLKLHGK